MEDNQKQLSTNGNVKSDGESSKSFERTINALRKLTYETVVLETHFFKEVHELEARYSKLSEPLRLKRAKIIAGEYIPTAEECNFPALDNSIYESFHELHEEFGDFRGVPRFWLTALLNTEIFDDMIEDHDEPVLEKLYDVTFRVSESEPMGFILEFHFNPNEYFSNRVLTKEYEMRNIVSVNEPFQFRGPEIIRSKGCVIDWKPGKNLTLKTVQCTRKLRSGAVNTYYKNGQGDSFFNFFQPVSFCLDECEDDYDRLLVSSDFEMGFFLRDRFVPRAVLFFTGEEFLDEGIDSAEMTVGDDEDEERVEATS